MAIQYELQPIILKVVETPLRCLEKRNYEIVNRESHKFHLGQPFFLKSVSFQSVCSLLDVRFFSELMVKKKNLLQLSNVGFFDIAIDGLLIFGGSRHT